MAEIGLGVDLGIMFSVVAYADDKGNPQLVEIEGGTWDRDDCPGTRFWLSAR